MKAGHWVAIGVGVVALGAVGFLALRRRQAAAATPTLPPVQVTPTTPPPGMGSTALGANQYDVAKAFAGALGQVGSDLAKSGFFTELLKDEPTDAQKTQASADSSTAKL